jgi:hypothetical protein
VADVESRFVEFEVGKEEVVRYLVLVGKDEVVKAGLVCLQGHLKREENKAGKSQSNFLDN